MFTDLEVGEHTIIVRATATADPTQTATYNIRISVTKPGELTSYYIMHYQ